MRASILGAIVYSFILAIVPWFPLNNFGFIYDPLLMVNILDVKPDRNLRLSHG